MLSPEFYACFDRAKESLRADYVERTPSGYSDLLERSLNHVMHHYDDFDGPNFDTGRIKSVSTGSYQGSLYFLIPTDGYSEDCYTASCSYGSCSHCDAFEACEGYGNPDFDGFVRLSLHLLQSLKRV